MKKETAKAIYNEVPVWMKKVLVDEFGEKTFVKNYTDIKTIEDAIEALGMDSSVIERKPNETSDEWAYRMLKIVVKAINQDWIADWNNSNQKKYWPYFNLSSGFGFSGTDYFCDYTFTFVGSRLCFESEEKAKYAGNQFLQLYKDFLTITK